MGAGVGPGGDAGGLDLLAERDVLVPGPGVLPATVGEELRGVPDAVRGVGVVEHQERPVVRADLDHAGQQRLAHRLAGDVEAGGVEQLAEVGQRPLGDQPVEVDLAGAGVVDDIRRGAVDEARLQGLADLLRRGVLDLRLGIGGAVHRLVRLGVLVAEAAVEDDDLQRRVLGDAERVLGGPGALVTVTVVPAVAGGAAGEQAGGGGGEQAGGGGTTEDVTPVHGVSSDRGPAASGRRGARGLAVGWTGRASRCVACLHVCLNV